MKTKVKGILALISVFFIAVIFACLLIFAWESTVKVLEGQVEILEEQNNNLLTYFNAYACKKVLFFAYNSHINQTDSTPFITASGAKVSFQTLALSQDLVSHYVSDDSIHITGIEFGDTVTIVIFKKFIVEDVMNKRYKDGADIWTENYLDAINFGVREGFLIFKKRRNYD